MERALPAWTAKTRVRILDEVVISKPEVRDKADELSALLGSHVAAFSDPLRSERGWASGRPCGMYRIARLTSAQYQVILDAEALLPGIAFVAFESPLVPPDSGQRC